MTSFSPVFKTDKKPKHVLTSSDLSTKEIRSVLELAKKMHFERNNFSRPIPAVENRIVALIFEKQSLRTRVTFETATVELGGHPVYLTHNDIEMGVREPIVDIAKNLSRWVTMVVARVKSHQSLVELAEHSDVPVINALSDLDHPCQALADLLTIEQHFGNDKLKLAWIGDGNNVSNSFAVTAAKLGHEVVVCTPKGYEPDSVCSEFANISFTNRAADAASGAHVVTTDVWVSMGQESESEKRIADFADFQVNQALMSKADRDAIFLHCLPAKRGYEVSAEVIDGAQSVIYQQAENRLHAQKALMKLILDGVIE